MKKSKISNRILCVLMFMVFWLPPLAVLNYYVSIKDAEMLPVSAGGSLLFLVLSILIVSVVMKKLFPDTLDKLKDISKIAAEIEDADSNLMRSVVEMISFISESVADSNSAQQIVEIFSENINSLSSTSEQMSNSISAMATAAEEISTNINSVANSAEEMSVNTSSVASTTEEMSTNIKIVEKAINEMSRSVTNITDNAKNASGIADSAVQKAAATTEIMSRLGDSAREIGKVTGVIQIIAQQTNLLALNAAIEAASAGEAGKGFAVVANEVKELAKQTSAATEDITGKIEGIQNSTKAAIEAIKSISEIITDISRTQSEITAMVEHQKKASEEIAINVTQASIGVNDISKNINESAAGAKIVSRGINEIASGANDVARNIAETATGVRNLAEKQEEAVVLIKEATRYIHHATESSGRCRDGMNNLNVTIDHISDLVDSLNSTAQAE
jgi:methyl-accepting chemotaxis protein